MQPLLTQVIGPSGSGPFGIIAPLIPRITAPPFDGVWVPIVGAKAATLDLSGSMSTLSVDVFGSNLSEQPPNGYALTFGGTITDGDSIILTFNNPNLGVAPPAIVIPVVAADTTTTLAAKAAIAINANAALRALSISASSAIAVLTVNFPSIAPGFGAAGGNAYANITQISAAVTGGATETIAIAVLTSGTKIGASLTALGLTAISILPAYIKCRMTTLTGTGAFINGSLSASF